MTISGTFPVEPVVADLNALLSGLEELRANENIHIRHYLILDDEFTWWQCGRSYLCRIIDMLHMGYVDEVLFGRETVERIPALVAEWVVAVRRRSSAKQDKL